MLGSQGANLLESLRVNETRGIREYPPTSSIRRMKALLPGPYLVRDQHGNRGYRMVEDDPRISDFSVLHVPDIFDANNETLSSYLKGHRVFALLDPAMTSEPYIDEIRGYLDEYEIDYVLLPLERRLQNEMNKTSEVLEGLVERVASQNPIKHDVILAVGGGVTKDLGGYLASDFRRFMLSYLVVPTTLTCMVDAAISPKTGLNVAGYKNILGTVYAPSAVLYDPVVLKTLRSRHLSAGMAEVLKIAIIRSRDLFRSLEDCGVRLFSTRFQGPLGTSVIDLAILLFLKMKYEQPFPGNEPASLRAFGHSFSRSLEQLGSFDMEHGEAVAVEICVAANLAFLAGILPWIERERILLLLHELNLPSHCCECTPRNLWSVFDRKYKSKHDFYFPVPGERIGEGRFLKRFSFKELEEAIRFLPSCEQERMLAMPQARS